MSAKGDYFPRQVNQWFANAVYAADVNLEGRFKVDLTPSEDPVAAAAAGILSAVDVTTAGSTTTFVPTFRQTLAQMLKFGRCLQVVGSAVGMAQVITVRGFDYLGQPMTENMTLNGTTAVNGIKAFRWITSISWNSGTAGTINLGWRDVFGLPYAMWQNTAGTVADFIDGVLAGTLGTFVAQFANAQTATTADPRGTYAPNASFVPNGSRRYLIYYEPNRNNLYGNAHFSS